MTILKKQLPLSICPNEFAPEHLDPICDHCYFFLGSYKQPSIPSLRNPLRPIARGGRQKLAALVLSASFQCSGKRVQRQGPEQIPANPAFYFGQPIGCGRDPVEIRGV